MNFSSLTNEELIHYVKNNSKCSQLENVLVHRLIHLENFKHAYSSLTLDDIYKLSQNENLLKSIVAFSSNFLEQPFSDSIDTFSLLEVYDFINENKKPIFNNFTDQEIFDQIYFNAKLALTL